eukprot:CAMPEP_0171836132 /NCGR_PEP_ID=MMETSP0992-20121227/11389_1 /TAXON_ID=483369 /ORGANISM="non described non described, Strain CCMP2098" /LENGTH=231 /DNA_ID=CAMNT_0012452073 /DNA_START=82 /DNA_END=777 /DNA_ORIENTATION=+
MFRSSVIALALFGSASAFAPAARTTSSTSLSAKAKVAEPQPLANGWTPDASKFAYGLPGSLEPVGEFDPLGLSTGLPLDVMKRYREAEVTHGRVAMLAALGFLVGENFHPLFGLDGKEILGIDSLTEVRYVFPQFFELLAVGIAAVEINRANIGWNAPSDPNAGVNLLREDYYPGDIGFDPLGLKPTDADEFNAIQTKELQNGRLAMLAVAGFVAQELVDGKPILLNDFGI